MTRREYRLLDVFTDRAFGGNQLAVFQDGRGIGDATMQLIATELQLAETTFVFPPTSTAADHRVRIFTPARELPFAGHPTLGTAFVLSGGRDGVVRLEEGVGTIPVTFTAGFGQMVQLNPAFTTFAGTKAQLAASVSLEVSDLRSDLPLEIGSSGVPFVFAQLRDLDAVRRARPRPGVVSENVYIFAMGGERPGATVHGRMFGAYLVRHGLVAPARTVPIASEQGFEMGRPSILEVEIDSAGGTITAARVGGRCVPMGGGWFEL